MLAIIAVTTRRLQLMLVCLIDDGRRDDAWLTTVDEDVEQRSTLLTESRDCAWRDVVEAQRRKGQRGEREKEERERNDDGGYYDEHEKGRGK